MPNVFKLWKVPNGLIEGFFREDDVSSFPFNGGFSPHILFIDGYYRGDERQLSSQNQWQGCYISPLFPALTLSSDGLLRAYAKNT